MACLLEDRLAALEQRLAACEAAVASVPVVVVEFATRAGGASNVAPGSGFTRAAWDPESGQELWLRSRVVSEARTADVLPPGAQRVLAAARHVPGCALVRVVAASPARAMNATELHGNDESDGAAYYALPLPFRAALLGAANDADALCKCVLFEAAQEGADVGAVHVCAVVPYTRRLDVGVVSSECAGVLESARERACARARERESGGESGRDSEEVSVPARSHAVGQRGGATQGRIAVRMAPDVAALTGFTPGAVSPLGMPAAGDVPLLFPSGCVCTRVRACVCGAGCDVRTPGGPPRVWLGGGAVSVKLRLMLGPVCAAALGSKAGLSGHPVRIIPHMCV